MQLRESSLKQKCALKDLLVLLPIAMFKEVAFTNQSFAKSLQDLVHLTNAILPPINVK